MLSTRAVLALLRDANPGVPLTEDRVRHALRRGEFPTPATFSGRLAWAPEDVRRLAAALGVAAPPADAPSEEGVR